MVNPVFVDNVPPAKSDARAYLVYRVSGIETLRNTNFQGTWTVFAADVRGWFWRDSGDTTSADNGTTIIVGPNGERWKLIITEGGGIFINAAGDTAGRDLYDNEPPPFAYYDTEQALLFVKNSSTPGDWSDGIDIAGPAGPQGPAGTITIGDVTTVGPSDPADVRNVGTSTNAVLDFDIPKGDKGDKGDQGDLGPKGDTGPTGPNTGLDYAFSTGTSGDPGSGNIATNTGNFSGTVTSIRISETGRNGEALAAVIASWGTSTNPGNLGTIRLFTVADRTEWIEATVTAITDNGAYRTLTVTKLGGNSAPSATDIMSVSFARTGDQGAAGAGTGDVVGPSSATDNAVTRWDTTSGKLVQDSKVTIADTGLMTITNDQDAANLEVQRLQGDRATPTANDLIYQSWVLSDAAGNQDEFARISARAQVVTSGSENGQLLFGVRTSGTFANELILTGATLAPFTNDGLALGTSSLGYADAFFASGANIWFSNQIRLTHGTGTPNSLSMAGGILDCFGLSGSNTAPARFFNDETTGAPVLLDIYHRPGTPAGNTFGHMRFWMRNDASEDTVYAVISPNNFSAVDGSETGRLQFRLMNNGTLATVWNWHPSYFGPWTDGAGSLGQPTGFRFANAYFVGGGTLNWGNGNVVFTHSTGVLDLTAGELRVAGNRVLDAGVENQNISGGAEITVKTLGTITTGTVTVDAGDCPWQSYTNNGAHALAATIGSGKAGWCNLVITNDASAGAIDVSDFPLGVEGDAFTTVNGDVFDCAVKIGPGVKRLIVKAMQ